MLTNAVQIGAGEFKAKCLKLMDQVYETHVPIIITKHGIPIARLVSIDEEPIALFGAQRGSVVIQGDIISPIEESWDANQ